MKRMIRVIGTTVALAVAPALVAQPFAAEQDQERARSRAEADRGRQEMDRAYREAQRSLDKREWAEAARQFALIAAEKGSRADAAFYWKAYAERKQSQNAQALATLAAMEAAYPNSRWINDAKALEIEMKQAAGQPVPPESTSDEDLKLMALNGLLYSDPEAAMPILQKMLAGSGSPKVKERALFVLAQSGSPKSREILLQVAKGGSNPDLQIKAIRNLGISGGKQNGEALAQIYGASQDTDVKRAVLEAYMISGNKEQVATLAKTEKDPNLRRHAIQQLGVMGDRATLAAMYETETDAGLKKQILNALFVAGDADRLTTLAKSEKDPGLRKAAIQFLGLTHKPGVVETLTGMYASESDASVKRQIQNALFIGQQPKALVEIARKESDPELKKSAVQFLSLMKSKESTDYMMELLNK